MEKFVVVVMIIVLETNQKAEWTSRKLQGKNILKIENDNLGHEAEDGWPWTSNVKLMLLGDNADVGRYKRFCWDNCDGTYNPPDTIIMPMLDIKIVLFFLYDNIKL